MEADAAVLAANRTFYRAFAAGDFGLMDVLWSHRAPVACIHPGWPPVRGRADVMEAWRGILANPPRPPVRAVQPVAEICGESAYVICYEAIGDIYLVATNLFLREEGVWKMIHHQSGQTDHHPGREQAARRTLH